jgi:ABC-2 type transport system permease protein
MSIRRALEVALREFRTTVLTKSFLFGVVILPAIVWGLAIAMPLLLHEPPRPLVGKVALSGADEAMERAFRSEFDRARVSERRERETGRLEAAISAELPPAVRDQLRKQLERLLEEPLPEVEVERLAPGADLADPKERVRTGDLLALIEIDPAVLTTEIADNHCELFLGEGVTRKHFEELREAAQRAVVVARAEAAGVDLEHARRVLAQPAVVTTTVTRAGGEAKDSEITRILVPMAFMLLVWMASWITGNFLLTSTIEEKSSRVIEVLLSAVSPLELLSGKILGQCCVGLVMLAIYGGGGVGAALQFGYAHFVPPEKLAFLLLYFVMAYLMVASTMAAVGSAVNELREAQSLLGPVTLVFMVPLLAWFFISDNPNSAFATAISFVPPMTPFTMILRVTAVESVPTWQIVATTVVGFAGVLGMIWAAAKIFRIGVLSAGKAPSPAELWRWLRMG